MLLYAQSVEKEYQLDGNRHEADPLMSAITLCKGLCYCLQQEPESIETLVNRGTDHPCVSPGILAELMFIAPYASAQLPLTLIMSSLIQASAAIGVLPDSFAAAAQAMRILADVFDDHPWLRDKFSGCTLDMIKWDHPPKNCTPSYREADLRLRGYSLARMYGELVSAEEANSLNARVALDDKIGKWYEMAQRAANENNVSWGGQHIPQPLTQADVAL